MLNNWIFLTVISGISFVLFNAANRHALKDGSDSTVYGWIFEVIRFAFFASLIPFNFYVACGLSNHLILIALGFSELAGVYFFMKMHAQSELSVSSILIRFRVILVPLFAFIFLGERLSLVQYVGVVTIFTGCIVVAGMKQIRESKGIWYAIGFVLINSVTSVLQKSAVGVASLPVVAAAFSFPAAVLMPFLMKSAVTRIRLIRWPAIKATLIAASFNIVTVYTMTRAFQIASAGEVSSIYHGVTTLSVVVGIFLFNERDHKSQKLFGAILTTIGILLLI